MVVKAKVKSEKLKGLKSYTVNWLKKAKAKTVNR